MFVEMLDNDNRSALFTRFFEATTQALIEVFDKTEGDARRLVEELRLRFADAPTGEHNLLLHNDPVALASELAEVPWCSVDAGRLEAFNRRRRGHTARPASIKTPSASRRTRRSSAQP